MKALVMKKTLFSALAYEALFVCPLRTEIAIADLRQLVVSFVNEHRALLLEGAREQDLDHPIFTLLDAIEAFVLYDHVEPLLEIKPQLNPMTVPQLQSAALLIGGAHATQLRYVIERAGKMISLADDRKGCWDFVRNQTMDRMCRAMSVMVFNAKELLVFTRWATSELGLSEQRLCMQQEAAYYLNRLKYGYDPICL